MVVLTGIGKHSCSPLVQLISPLHWGIGQETHCPFWWLCPLDILMDRGIGVDMSSRL